ncbi:transcriptional regulator, AraC family [Fibrisoma limi BUZ 3]|uniref:Transcriptional regulator, AraC family n=1 Tax=Fibrisoma limi BUZ 3 TaxID=1185876 RepID=I2GLG3_9BACT|nr:helix-turn-helix transcriptional regulator [Fibrisoma limi]CCH54739.1 transcriptional regulator, AraC family [Fibrisoma limi BUZ 3]
MIVRTHNQPVPTYTLEQDPVLGGTLFSMARFEGTLTHQSDLLTPHRKNYYLLVFVQRGNGRHWVDMTPYVTKANTVYFFGPNQLVVKEDPKPFWSTGIAFTTEFLALQENVALSKLPLIQNPQNGHELLLTEADVAFVNDTLEKLYAEYQQHGEWQQRMLAAYLTVLITYLSRLYTEQFKSDEPSADKLLVKKYQAKIDECFRDLHEVGEYASLLNLSAGHLSEVVKAQSGKPAITHIHERLVLEARRLLFHTQHSAKEIAFDLGFSDPSYFTRFFKRETGVTPADYRTTIREMYH